MKIKSCFVTLGLVGILLMGISATGMAGEDALPAADGQAVYEYISQTSPYQQWDLFPGKEKFYKGAHPHGALLTTYVSKGALEALNNKSGQFPDGAFIVKENYLPDKTLGAVTVMYRINDYNADAGDWFWAKYQADGSIEKEGKVAGCIGCHTAAIGNDWVFTGPVK